MLFSSISFLYFFLPLVLAVYFLAPAKLKNAVLLGASLFFYFYGEPLYSVLIIISCLSGYIHGLWISKANAGDSRWKRKLAVTSAVITGLLFLVVFKYADFLIENLNLVPGINIPLPGLRLPIGISFYTFQLLSYTLDVHKQKVKPQKNLASLTTYVALFPQLIAGPIVRYSTIEAQLSGRKQSLSGMAYGISRFVAGLAKKVIIANTLGDMALQMSRLDEKTVLYYWLAAISFMLQIYFDFSAYSDMAIGLGRMFGFNFPENFNYPFISTSITEFWRRWHISLGTWFRDYVYIPLGGNRVGKRRWILNIFLVWSLTGLWHGAAWNFVIWGLLFALVLVCEKLFLQKILLKIPVSLRHLYTLIIVLISFVIFNSPDLAAAGRNLAGMLGQPGLPLYNREILFYLSSYTTVLAAAALGSTPIIRDLAARLLSARGMAVHARILQPAANVVLLLICTAYLVDGSFNPFLYFRF